jgi:hypothetical protein
MGEIRNKYKSLIENPHPADIGVVGSIILK